jgi:galactokinase
MIEHFRQLYGSAEDMRVFRAPGRVNLIGEHTDYNLGLVLPMTLDRATFVAAAPSGDGQLRIYSEDKKELREWQNAQIAELRLGGDWTDYPIGVAQQLLRAGFPLEPANFLIRSTVPEGAGLSSSAALEVSMALAWLRGRPLAPRELARLCQRAEREFVGIPSGIMDQYVSLFGQADSALELDCRSLEHRLVPLPAGIAFAAVNTMVKHALAASAYKERVAECAEAARGVQLRYPEVRSLRDVTPEQLAAVAASLPPVIARRARHVITENARVERFVEACRRNDAAVLGRLLVESHSSLRKDYEVSCGELDFLVETALALGEVHGARMTGGGFGGCAVALLETSAWARFRKEMTAAYERRFRITPQIYSCRPSAGASEVHDWETIPSAA